MSRGEQTTIRVNFSTPFPIFPLDTAALLPHALIRLFIFERRYRQMVRHAIDGSGQIAMAVFDGDDWRTDYEDTPPVRSVVCVGQIAEHERNADGTYILWLRGVCRGRIVHEIAPDAEVLYRRASLEPLTDGSVESADLERERKRMSRLLSDGPLAKLNAVQRVVREMGKQGALPPDVYLDVLSLPVLSLLQDHDLQRRFLEEPNPVARARLLERELGGLAQTLEGAKPQFDPEAPRGVSWN